jgi:flotillin
MSGFIAPLIIFAILFVIFFIGGYLKAPPDTAYIITGLGKRKILIGRAGWRLLFFTRVDKLSLRVMQVDVKTSEAVPTNEFINVVVDGVANIKISSTPNISDAPPRPFSRMRQPELINLVTQVLEGNMREIVGSVGLKEMVQDRQGVAKKITENVVPDMDKLGIEVVNFNIQNFKDAAGTIENMGIDNIEQIRKNAQIARAHAQRDIAIATSKAQEEANAIKVEAEKKIAEQNASLSIQQAEMQIKADTKKAEADAAYSIQQENQRKTIEITKANANIARSRKNPNLPKPKSCSRKKCLTRKSKSRRTL